MNIFDAIFGPDEDPFENGPLYCPVCDNIYHACTCDKQEQEEE